MGIRNFLLLAGWVFCAATSIGISRADTFTATYTPLKDATQTASTNWNSGGVTNDGKFLYGLGHSHNTNGDNSLWLYDPATDSHRQLQPNTGGKWLYTPQVNNSGRWGEATGSLATYFGGPTINALTNRNNHQAFYLPARNEFWVLAGTTFYQGNGHFAGRFDLATERWSFISTLGTPDGVVKPGGLGEFSAGLIAPPVSWVAPNAATVVCADLNTVVMFGGMGDATGTVRVIEPNPAGPEPYRMTTAPKPPFHFPAENMRHNAACAGDTVYFVEGQRKLPGVKCCSTPNPAQVWKFHVPSRVWTRLSEGPPGGYFPVVTYDSDAKALLYYGGGTGGGSTAVWAYDLLADTWHDLTAATAAPKIDMHIGGFIPGFGHVYKGGRVHNPDGSTIAGASRRMHKIALTRTGEAVPPPPPPPDLGPVVLQCPAGCTPIATAPPPEPTPEPCTPDATGLCPQTPPPEPVPDPTPPSGASSFTWTTIKLPGYPKSPQGSMKHQRLIEGPDGRVYILGGDFGGGASNIGRQLVYSFDPRVADGDWRMEAQECGTVENPVHWHTDEAGVAWDAKRKVFWKLAGSEYGPDDACFLAGKSAKAKVITFDPATKLWTVPAHVVQKRFGYVTNGVLDPAKDELVQITDKTAFHLSLETGQWASHGLPGDEFRFNAISARIGRDVWWLNREEVLESYNLDTHTLKAHGVWPFPPRKGWGASMTFALGNKVLAVWPNHLSTEPKSAALYDPATKQWTVLDQGEGRGNTGMIHSSGKLILMGGMAPPEDHNKFVWVGALS